MRFSTTALGHRSIADIVRFTDQNFARSVKTAGFSRASYDVVAICWACHPTQRPSHSQTRLTALISSQMGSGHSRREALAYEAACRRRDELEASRNEPEQRSRGNRTDNVIVVRVPAQPRCKFRVMLHNTIREVQEQRVVSTLGYPSSLQTIKQAIEDQLSVPVCVQTVRYRTQLIHDTTSLNRLRVREEDMFDVYYPNEARVRYVCDLISSLRRIISVLQAAFNSLTMSTWITPATRTNLRRECHEFVTDNLPLLKYFSVFPTGFPNSNQLYFIDKGGVVLLLQIYSTLHCLPWHRLSFDMQRLEYACLKIFRNFSATLGVRQLILRQNIINEVFKSLMRTKIERYKAVALPGELADSTISENQSLHVLAETVYSALVVIGK